MKKYFVSFLKFLLFLSVGLVILFLVYRQQNAAYQAECELKGIPASQCSLFDKVLNDFASANYWWILLVLLAFTISNISRAIRWNMLIHPLGYRPRLINSFFAVILNYFANLGLPRMGEIVRAGTITQYEKIPLEKVVGTVVVDRIIDVISILLLSALVILLEYDRIWSFVDQHVSLSDKFGSGANILLSLLGIAGLFVVLFYLLRERIRELSIFRKIVSLAKGFTEGLQTVRKLERPWLFLFHSVNIWLMYFTMTYLCFFAFAPTAGLSPLAALVVFVFGGWGVVIPSPGGMGTYHFLAQTALMMFGVSGEDGFSWANISFFSIQIGCNILVGILALIVLPIINRNYHPMPVTV